MNRHHPHWPLVIAYGAGVDSTAVLVEFANQSIRPDLILFADTGGEKNETYAYLNTINAFLKTIDFPEVVVVKYRPRTAPYHTLEAQCLYTGTLPSIACGGRSCSIKYKNYVDLGIMWSSSRETGLAAGSARNSPHNVRVTQATPGCPGQNASGLQPFLPRPLCKSPGPWPSWPSRC